MKPKTKSILIITSTLLTGIIIGFLLCGVIVKYRMSQANSLKTQEGFLAGLDKIIEPDQEQKEKMKPVYDRIAQEYAEITKKNKEDLKKFADLLYSELRPILNKKQIERLDGRMKLSPVLKSELKTSDSNSLPRIMFNERINRNAELKKFWLADILKITPEKAKLVYEISTKYYLRQQALINRGINRLLIAKRIRMLNFQKEKELQNILSEDEFKSYMERKDEITLRIKERMNEKNTADSLNASGIK